MMQVMIGQGDRWWFVTLNLFQGLDAEMNSAW